jgi:F-type H+-transporting ATPase subunit b
VSLSAGLRAASPAVLWLSEETAEHAAKFLGLPLWVWQILNLVLFFAVLLYFVARPMAEAFRRRQLEVEERRQQTEKQRGEVQKLSAEIRDRTARLEREIEEIRREGLAEGQRAQAALLERANQEAERIRKDSQEEIERRLLAAKAELRRAAADLTASAAKDLVSREMTAEDRQRLLSESVERMKEVR